jgi:hypothetical protein
LQEEATVMRLSGLAILVSITSLFLFATAWAGGPWSLFGNAYPIKEGLKPNSWAVALPSRCPETSSNCLADGALVYSGVSFKAPNRKLTFREIYQLSTSYKITEWDCGGGSPRFTIGIDTDARFDIGQLVQLLPYLTYWEALTALGDVADKPVLYVMLVVDGGWLADQVVLVDKVTVNNFRHTAGGYAKK